MELPETSRAYTEILYVVPDKNALNCLKNCVAPPTVNVIVLASNVPFGDIALLSIIVTPVPVLNGDTSTSSTLN